jgi:hypothetical protein
VRSDFMLCGVACLISRHPIVQGLPYLKLKPGRVTRFTAHDGMASGAGTPGLLEIGPWMEYDGDRVVRFSHCESRQASEAAMPGSGVPNDIIHNDGRRPREYFHLVSDVRVTPSTQTAT